MSNCLISLDQLRAMAQMIKHLLKNHDNVGSMLTRVMNPDKSILHILLRIGKAAKCFSKLSEDGTMD
jgi:hypothetical protein